MEKLEVLDLQSSRSSYEDLSHLVQPFELEEDKSRTIYIDDHEKNSPFRYPNNYVKTSKYTWWNFIIKNVIFEQFRRYANIYFLIVSLLQQIPNISPTGKYTTLIPLIIVLSVTALKEAYEDLHRHRQDREVNNRKVQVLRGSKFEFIPWKDVLVGDIVKVVNGDYIPADLILLSSSEPDGLAYIETANLDGETNLKSRQAIPETHHSKTVELLQEYRGSLMRTELPNQKLYHFTGFIQIKDKKYSLSAQQTLLRGAMLRNTKWVFGVAFFTGHDTKLMKNANKAPVKRSNVERVLNIQVLLIFCLLILISAVCTIGYSIWQSENVDSAWYLLLKEDTVLPATGSLGNFLAFLTFIILFNNLVPISLYVTVELVKFGQAYFINNDEKMYYEENDTPALARTSNLNEELGQVQYIFSDKTGTLTANRMEFKKCTFGGKSYGSGETEISLAAQARKDGTFEESRALQEFMKKNNNKKEFTFDDQRLLEDLKNGENSRAINEALHLLALCHTVIPEETEDGMIFQASSPDENALVVAAKCFGFTFSKRTQKTLAIRVDGQEKEYKLLNVLEFTSARKRMSVILEDPEGKIILYCKGADTVIYERLGENQEYKESTAEHLKNFAVEGLRTLCLAKAEINREEYLEWQKKFEDANTRISNREEELSKVAELIEKNLFLLGATGVEDKLQDGVPETIATLAKAGIKIWVLTGDKQETAINIGFACKLLRPDMELIIVNKKTKGGTKKKLETLLKTYEEVGEENEDLALVIDGETLNFALEDDLQLTLLELAVKCKAVICCRVTPLQKASIVRLVRVNKSAISLAIGDGANDVSMIQEAHVGVGISGEEGLQAARASDYSIAQFRFLKRLLLIHGRWSYRRISKVILYSFYKNILLYFTQFWYTFLNGASGQSLFERWTLGVYNILFTSIPVIVFGILDQDISDVFVNKYPELYRSGQRKYLFNIQVFWGVVLNAVYHSFLVFILTVLIYDNGVIRSNGTSIDLWSMGTTMYTCIVIIVTLKLALEARYWTKIFLVALGISMALWLLWLLVYSTINLWPIGPLRTGEDLLWVPYQLFASPVFYLSVFLIVVIAISRDVIWKFVYRTYFPRSYHLIQEKQKLDHSMQRDRSGTWLTKNQLFQKKKRPSQTKIKRPYRHSGFVGV